MESCHVSSFRYRPYLQSIINHINTPLSLGLASLQRFIRCRVLGDHIWALGVGAIANLLPLTVSNVK